MKRAMCLYMPFLSTDRWPERAKSPVATVTPHGQSLRIAHVNRVAANEGVRGGQTLAAAKAITPELVAYDDDPAADRRRLESLAVWAGNYSPLVHIEDESTLIVDVTGCERLYDGEANLLRQAVAGLAAQGFFARGAIADTLGAAWAVAHAHPDEAVVVPAGCTTTELTLLPVWSLRVDAKIAESLALVGVETIASLLYLPRSSLTSRFGEGLLDRLDQTLGNTAEVLKPYRPASLLSVRFPLGAATTRLEVLIEAARQASIQFCERLEKRNVGAREIFVTFDCPDVETEEGSQTRYLTRVINLSQPTRSSVHLCFLLKVLVEQLRLPAPADVLTLWARQLDPLDDWQDELFATEASDFRVLGDLLDRLTARLGGEVVVRPQLLSEHQPERAFRYVSVVDAPPKNRSEAPRRLPIDRDSIPPAAQGEMSGPRPLRLLEHPMEIAATAVVPEGPPVAIRFHGTQHALATCVGPERIETGWWRGPHVQRDYYRMTTESGRRGWIFRDRTTGRWFLHGWFD
ncbi:MAG: DNA polymerase Y family protein [Planctomycetes bacterium]|nr:DNA polymerase Y family protein [Planctomycetota bacterium]